MKLAAKKFLLTALKTSLTLFTSVSMCLILLALKTKERADDLWKQLGITQSVANINIQVSVTSDFLQYAGARNAKNIAVGNRAAVINDLVAYSKKFTSSAEFKKMYEFERSKHRPANPAQFKINMDSLRTVEKQRIEQEIKNTEANANSTNTKIKNAVPYRLEALRKELAEVDNPNNKKIQAIVSELQSFNSAVTNEYQIKLQKFNEDFPENPQLIIKKRLQEILDITADVDYDAEIKQAGKFKVFVNPSYEKKSKEWKLAYRAGKSATDAVRAAAKKWLDELNRSGV
jgi:hypothetical protein